MRYTLLAFVILEMGMATACGDELLEQLTQFQDRRSRRVSSSDSDIDGNGDSKTILPGQTLVVAELDGPGVITHFWNTTMSLNPFSGRSLVLRMYWDGAKRPSVEVPLGDFFGVGHGAGATFQSVPVSVSSCGRSRTCYWRMPFRKHAKITVTSEDLGFGPAPFYYYLDWEQVDQLPEDTLYFHARYRQQSLLQFAGESGKTRSTASVLLKPALTGSERPREMACLLRGTAISDPFSIDPINPDEDPLFQCPDGGDSFCYPDRTVTSDALWWQLLIGALPAPPAADPINLEATLSADWWW